MIIEFRTFIEFYTENKRYLEYDRATIRANVLSSDNKIACDITEIQIDNFFVPPSRLTEKEHERLKEIAIEGYLEDQNTPKRLKE